jgi:hypothetical protein
MSENARIRVIAEGVTAEMIAEQTHLFYDPATGGGSVSFQARESLFVAGGYQPLAGNFDILQANVADIMERQFAPAGAVDPVTGADLSAISAAGVMLVIKAAYDVLFNERAAALATEQPAP